MHDIPIAGCDPTPLCSVWFVLVVVVCFLFVCVLLFLVWFVFDGIANWTLYWSITSAFEAIDELTALHANLQFIFLLRLNVCNDLAKAMKALGRKKRSSLRSLRTFEYHCVLLCTTLLRRRVPELSNLCGLAQVRAVKRAATPRSCFHMLAEP